MQTRLRFVLFASATSFALTAGLVGACARQVVTPPVANALDPSPTVDAGAGSDRRRGRLVFVAQKDLAGIPDLWEPHGRAVAVADGCNAWDVATGFYRGALDESVCEAWREAAPMSPDGTWVERVNGSALTVSPAPHPGDDGWSRAHEGFDLVETCADGGVAKPCAPVAAFAWSPEGDAIAVVRQGALPIAIWDLKTRAVRARLELGPSLDSVTAQACMGWSGAGLALLPDRPANGSVSGYATWPPDGGAREDLYMEGITSEVAIDPYGRFLFEKGIYPQNERMDESSPPPGFQEIVLLDKTVASRLAWGIPETHAVVRGTWSRDASHVAASEGTDVTVLSLAGDEPWSFSSRFTDPTTLALSPDGRRIALLWKGGLALADVAKREIHAQESITDGPITGAQWSADGEHLAIQYDGRTEVRRAGKKGVEVFWGNTTSAVFAPRGLLLAANQVGGKVQVLDVASRAKVLEAAGVVVEGSWSPDAGRLAVITPGGIEIWNTASGEKERGVAVATAKSVAWSPHGDAFAAAGDAGVAFVDATAGTVRASRETSAIARVLWPAEGGGGRIVTIDAKGAVAARDAQTDAIAAGLRAQVDAPGDLSPNGAWIAPERSKLRRVADGEEIIASAVGVVSRDGLFDGEARAVGWRVYRIGDDALSGVLVTEDRFAERMRHPGLFREFLAGKALKIPRAMAERVGPPPSIAVLPEADAGSDAGIPRIEPAGTGELHVTFKARDEGGGVARCRALLDGKPLDGWDERCDAPTRDLSFPYGSLVDAKPHVLTIDACNADLVCSEPLRFTLTKNGRQR